MTVSAGSMKKDELAHLIAMHRAAHPRSLLTYDQHYNGLVRLKKAELTRIAAELEMPTVKSRPGV